MRLTVLYDDLLLPNVLERDQAVRYGLTSRWPADGAANVRPLDTLAPTAVEGLTETNGPGGASRPGPRVRC